MSSEINEENIADVLKSLGNNGAEAFGSWIGFKNREMFVNTFIWLMFWTALFGSGLYIYDDISGKTCLNEHQMEKFETLQTKQYTWEQEQYDMKLIYLSNQNAYEKQIKELVKQTTQQ